MKLPVIFAGHGSPMIALEDNELTKEFQKIGERVVSEFEKPKAILSFSAHWFTRGTYVQSDPEPRQVYDMYGFPKELYEVQYHPKGCQELTDDILALLPDTSINDDWGIDHGTWTVLVHMFPGAPIPVVQLSIDGIEGPQSAYDIGKALAPLREKGYLLLGSGNIVHNLRRLEWDNPNGSPQADRFDAAYAAPTADHFLPLLYTLGAAQGEKPEIFNNVRNTGSLSMTGYLFGFGEK